MRSRTAVGSRQRRHSQHEWVKIVTRNAENVLKNPLGVRLNSFFIYCLWQQLILMRALLLHSTCSVVHLFYSIFFMTEMCCSRFYVCLGWCCEFFNANINLDGWNNDWIVLTSGDAVRAGAECRARYSLCQHRQSNIKSLSCIKLLIDLGLSSPAALPPSVYESRFENDDWNERNRQHMKEQQQSIKKNRPGSNARRVTICRHVDKWLNQDTVVNFCFVFAFTLSVRHTKQQQQQEKQKSTRPLAMALRQCCYWGIETHSHTLLTGVLHLIHQTQIDRNGKSPHLAARLNILKWSFKLLLCVLQNNNNKSL